MQNDHHNIADKGFVKTDSDWRYSCKDMLGISLVKIVCIIPQEEGNNLKCSLLG